MYRKDVLMTVTVFNNVSLLLFGNTWKTNDLLKYVFRFFKHVFISYIITPGYSVSLLSGMEIWNVFFTSPPTFCEEDLIPRRM